MSNYRRSDWETSGGTGEFSSYAFDQQQSFESFSYGGAPAGGAYVTPGAGIDPNAGSMSANIYSSPAPTYFVPQMGATGPTAGSGNEFDVNYQDEPPLLEELGINPYQIMEKTMSVLNPLRNTEASILQDTDLAGPVVFCVLFGFLLLLSGKVSFGYIYGIGVIGCVGMYFLLNMMSQAGVSLGVTVSVLGYCLLPMVGLAGVNLLLSLQDLLGTILTVMTVIWCSLSASKLFVTALDMQKQQPLVAYPCALVYGVFALLAVF